ncbi:Kae1-associated serine/threonine protein kinase [Candidatus Woesearchaeota archaeon]|nr:Kae1-associated serine/threonine protein kinase [Candidatus Woesearchaeota archaeon]
MEELSRGAEAILYLNGDRVIKKRISKGYRIKELDLGIRKLRTRSEGRILEKINIDRPKVYRVDEKEMEIEMDFIKGNILRDVLEGLGEHDRVNVCRLIGENVGKLHESDIVHGDLTTSNFIFNGEKVYFIDFGLAFFSKREEDKAVDLKLLKDALDAKHYSCSKECFENIIEGYKNGNKFHNLVLNRLNKVEGRGRYKGKS